MARKTTRGTTLVTVSMPLELRQFMLENNVSGSRILQDYLRDMQDMLKKKNGDAKYGPE
jgi:hypothetical protein